MALHCSYSSLVTESDVEQKLIYPLLSSPNPMGYNFDETEIFTKSLLKQRKIDKGTKQKYYYPDYLIMIRGIPVLVVEAKKPNEDLANAFSEARLYAQEVNAQFQHSVNVCQLIMVSSGAETWIGFSDCDKPEIVLEFEDINIENIKFVDSINFFSRKKLEDYANKPYLDMRGKAKFNTPVSLLGGKRVQNEEMVENSFGRTLVFENRNIFDPETEQDRYTIVKNAYIKSAKREQHIEPIYKEIKKFELPSMKHSTLLSSDNPTELVEKISRRVDDKIEAYSLMLIIGNVGSGKTTFVRYFKHIFLETNHNDLACRCEWVFINMNPAPLNNVEIYNWLRTNIKKQIIENHPEYNFDELDTIKKIFRRELHKFHIGVGKLLKDDDYDAEIFNILSANLTDDAKYLDGLLSFLKEYFCAIPIIVLDNSDKRNTDEQLLMFEVAQWLRTEYKCIVIMPIRDTTYDVYRDEPPLDTIVKDLVFRIDPPDLLKVLQARLDYITRTTDVSDNVYMLQNGMRVPIKKADLTDYFKCLMMAIRKSTWTSRVFYSLSDRNTRNGIQLFEDFCKSGHINADEIFMIRTASDTYELPSYKLINALLRKNRRYFNDEQSNFVNLFYCYHTDDFPDPFIRVDILLWLKNNRKKEGPARAKGLFPASHVIKQMQIIGHNADITLREIDYLTKRGLLFSENQSQQVLRDDLIKITMPGNLHLLLLSNLSYLAACAEDINYKNSTIMINISHRLANPNYLDKLSMSATVSDMINYLDNYRKEYAPNPQSFMAEGSYSQLYDLSDCKSSLSNWIAKDNFVAKYFDLLSRYPHGSKVVVSVVSKNKGSLICSSDNDFKGFIAATDDKYDLSYEQYSLVNQGSILECEILEFDFQYRSFQLKYLSTVSI